MTPTIRKICEAHRVTPEDFFGPGRGRKIGAVRKAAVLALAGDGFSIRSIARLIKRDHSVVWYWIDPQNRERKIDGAMRRKGLRE